MTSIGETLRRERLKRNLELGQISQVLKISSRMLAAIEEEKFDRLPGGVFSRSFVRQYASYLGLDPEEIGGRVEPMLEPLPDEPKYAEPVRPSSTPIQVPPVENWETVGGRRFSEKSPLTALGMVVVAMLGCAGVYAWWTRSRRPVVAHDSPVPANAPVRTSVRGSAPVAAPALAPASVPAAPQPLTPPLATIPAATAAGSGLPQPELNPNAAVRVQMTAAEPVWVRVRSDGRYVFEGVLEANQSRTVDANATVLLQVGNAGGMTVLLNGKPIGSLGPKGQVRNIQLTSGGFEIVAPKSPASLEPLEPI
jgi:cytoskeleton protein RodZ